MKLAETHSLQSIFFVFDEPEAGIDIWSFNNMINVFEKMRTMTNDD